MFVALTFNHGLQTDQGASYFARRNDRAGPKWSDFVSDLEHIEYSTRDIDYRFRFPPDLRFLYVMVPKAGTTTISAALGVSLGLTTKETIEGGWRSSGTAHDDWERRTRHWMNLSRDEKNHLLRSPDVYRFTSVRHPFPRLLSVFLDKIQVNRELYHSTLLFPDPEEVPVFSEFLRRVAKEDKRTRDIHWQTAFDLTLPDHISYSKVIRFENFESDTREVLQAINIPDEVPRPKYDFRAHEKVDQFYGPEEREIVQSAFSKDFQHFGY